MNFNKEQWYSVIRYIVVFGGGVLVAKGVLPKDFDMNSATNAIIAIVGGIGSIVTLIQSLNSKTDKNQIAAVAAMPDVAKIVVKQNASDGVAAAVQDITPPFAKVVPEGTSSNV